MSGADKTQAAAGARRGRAVLLRLVLGGYLLVCAGVLAVTGIVLFVPYPAATLSHDAGGPLVLVDRRGEVLRRLPARRGRPGRGEWVPLERISVHAVLALLAAEDKRFFAHDGVDPYGLLRAICVNLRGPRLSQGASTITMQLMKVVHSAGQPRTLRAKAREILLALRAERTLSKRAILEQYLNRVYFANGAWGIGAAARTYFDKPAASLSAGEAALLIGVVRGPSYYDPLRHLARARARQARVLALRVARGTLSAREAARARAQPLRLRPRPRPWRARHFVDWVVRTLPADQRCRGGVVHTTLDLPLQRRLERRVADHVAALKREGISNAALVLLDARSGAVRAMVGSADYRTSAINMVTRRRHPGSALKPFVYAAAIEGGDNPATIALDIRDVRGSAYRGHAHPERGPVAYREALAGSYNLAAIHVLERVGVERLLTRLGRAGIGRCRGSPRDYGLRLALGSAKVRLLDLAAGYAFLVQGGRVRPAHGVRAIALHDGHRVTPAAAPATQVFSPEASWLVLDMLADPQARQRMFGPELPLDMPFPVAAKTGTAQGFADAIAVGVTRELIAAAWAGNLDGRASHGLQGMRAAGPLVRAALLAASDGAPLTLPPRPAGIRRVALCPVSGMLPGPHCPQQTHELVIEGREPTARCGWHAAHAGRPVLRYPPQIAAWAARQRTRGGRQLAASR